MYFQRKIKFILEHTMKAQWVSGEGVWYSSTLFFNLGAKWGGRLTPRPGPFTQYLLYKRLGGPYGRSERVHKISPSPWFDPRTIQPVASHYTNYAIPDHFLHFNEPKHVAFVDKY